MEMLGNYVWVWIVTWLKCDAEVVHKKVRVLLVLIIPIKFVSM
jgi:hypothetical protein